MISTQLYSLFPELSGAWLTEFGQELLVSQSKDPTALEFLISNSLNDFIDCGFMYMVKSLRYQI